MPLLLLLLQQQHHQPAVNAMPCNAALPPSYPYI
jgi:hypothetical protein